MLELLALQLEAFQSQLTSLQSQASALQAIVAGAMAAEQAPTSCEHRETEVVGTFGETKLRCVACKAIVEP